MFLTRWIDLLAEVTTQECLVINVLNQFILLDLPVVIFAEILKDDVLIFLHMYSLLTEAFSFSKVTCFLLLEHIGIGGV